MISLFFFAFVAVLYIVLYFCNRYIKNEKKCSLVSNIILLVASYAFVAYADWRFALILAALTISTWFFAGKGKWDSLGIIIAVLTLGVFKYTNFFAESFAKIFGNDFTALNIILPLGISFYTFSAISYIVDVKRGKTDLHDFLSVALYLSFFPKITSGPIQKSADFFMQADKKRTLSWQNCSDGIQIFLFGLFKKIVIADRLSVFVNQVFNTPAMFGSLTLFLGVIGFSLQIYFDFSGYSDLAIGVGKILGFNLPRNFNLPYLSHNVTELWKRWHMTLSSWLMEYVYFSIGGNRKGTVRTYINLIVTMCIGGIWHGANLTYVVWGLLHGIGLAVHKLWMKITNSASKHHSALSDFLCIAFTFLFTSFCWIFFRAETLSDAMFIIRKILRFESGVEQPYYWLFFAILVLVGASISAFYRSRKKGFNPAKENNSAVYGYYPLLNLRKFTHLIIFFVFIGLLFALAYTGGSPFIYGKY